MTLTLSHDLEQIINQRVASGQYASADAVIRRALELLDEQEQFPSLGSEELRSEIAIGIEQLERGEFTEYGDHTLKDHFDSIKAEGRRRLAEQRQEQGGA